jgi:ATP-binding cassette subfamily G (WHITE) protein 2
MFLGVSSDDVHHEDQLIQVKESLVSAYKSNLADKLKAELQEINDNQFQDGFDDKQFGRWSTTWWQQFCVLFKRGVKERRHDSFSGLQIGEVVVVAFLAGLLWWQSDVSHLQDQVTNLFSLYFAPVGDTMILIMLTLNI